MKIKQKKFEKHLDKLAEANYNMGWLGIANHFSSICWLGFANHFF
jgi:hypothetical protein